MSIEHEILEILFEPRFRYKGISVSLVGLPELVRYNKNSIWSAVSRLKKKEYVYINNGFLKVRSRSQEYVKRRQERLKVFSITNVNDKSKNLLVIFDIPEEKKAEREWFRFHLKKFGFEMVQRSVWVGPSPLPKIFLDYIKDIGLMKCIKTFKLAKSYVNN